MTDVARTLGEFIAAWQAGERPQLPAYLERVPDAERDDLADQIQTYIMLAPEPAYDEATWAAMTSDPAVAQIAEATMGPEPWPELLPRLRARAKLSLADVAARLGLRAELQPKAEGLLEQMETGALNPELPSRTLLERLAVVLGVSAETLDWRGAGTQPGLALYRSTAEERDDAAFMLADLLLADGDDQWDEADELFLGGR